MKWAEVKYLPWRNRNAAVEAAMRAFLAKRPASAEPLSTKQLAAEIAPDDHDKALDAVLTKMAKWMGAKIATNDGPAFQAYGKTFKRWRWHGQLKGE